MPQLSSAAQSLKPKASSVHLRRAAHRRNQARRRVPETRETPIATFGYFAHPVFIVSVFLH
ncbi:hypothetical protein F2Q69_00060851 [Brassica cretica]|uniref:Uncharacterized protein n=1 Tax=Brassica cretica TaxID=69181 RepID=A0A8S9RDB3_BRACR|nr:hypothetical protein F2Q69_00060851 [Brassica cretica]